MKKRINLVLVTNFYESTIVLKYARQNKNYLVWYKFHKMCRPYNECVKGLPDILNFWRQQWDLSVTIKKIFYTHPYHIICISHVVYGRPPPPYIFFPRPPGVYNDPLWDNSILMASFNSCFIFSRLHLFPSSNSFLHSSLRFPIISFVHSSLRLTIISFVDSSLRLSIISANYCWVMDVEELLEPRDALP